MSLATPPDRHLDRDRPSSIPGEGRSQETCPLRKQQQRPPTKREVWAEVEETYADSLDHARRVQLARERWAWRYVVAVNFHGWRKQPDWTPGQPVIGAAVPRGPFPPERASYRHVQRLWQRAQRGRPSGSKAGPGRERRAASAVEGG